MEMRDVRKPMSDFMCFSKYKRPQILKDRPTVSFVEMTKILGEMWVNLSDNEKAPYIELAAKDKVRYDDFIHGRSDTR